MRPLAQINPLLRSIRLPTYDFTVARSRRYLLMDLFAGCGGMTRGFVDSGRFRPVFAVESDPDAAATYAANFGGAHIRGENIETVRDFPGVDVLIGGPPCQGFSPLNRSGIGFERRALWREYWKALRSSGARAFVMENVPQLLKSPEYAEFQKLARKFFTVEGRILDAADYGVPQRRRRAIVIGIAQDSIRWPERTHAAPNKLALEQQPWKTFREAVAGLSLLPDGRNWHAGRNPHPKSLLRYRAVPPDGGNRFQMQENLEKVGLGDLVLPCFRKKRSGTTDVFGRLWWDRPSVTIRTEFYKPEKGRYLHPSADRPITVREAARLMSLDDGFILPEDQSMTSIARQIGNAVPPVLARQIADAVAAQLDAPAVGAACA
jgi:DNA (cytosine-5)-methyltransferase 1